MIILPVWSSINDNFASVEFKFKSKSKPPCHPLPASRKRFRSLEVRGRNHARFSPSVDYGVPSELRSKASSHRCRGTLYRGYFHFGGRPHQSLEDNLISHLTYNDGTERVSLKLLDISKLRKIGPFHEVLCDRENVYALTTTSGQPWNPKTGVNIVLTPKVLEEAPNRQQLQGRQLPCLLYTSPSPRD